MLKVVIKDRCVLKKWLYIYLSIYIIGQHHVKSSFGANNETFLWHLNSCVSTLPNETFLIPAFLQSCEFDNLGTNIFGFHTFCFRRVVFFPASETHQRLLTNFRVLWNILSYGKKTNFRGCSDALVSDMYPRIWKSTHLSLTKLGSATYALWSLLPHMPHMPLIVWSLLPWRDFSPIVSLKRPLVEAMTWTQLVL